MIFDQTPTSKAMEIIAQVKTKDSALFIVKNIQDTIMTDELYNPGNTSFERVDDYWENVKNVITLHFL